MVSIICNLIEATQQYRHHIIKTLERNAEEFDACEHEAIVDVKNYDRITANARIQVARVKKRHRKHFYIKVR